MSKRPQTIEQRQKQVISRLKNENVELRDKIKKVEAINKKQSDIIEKISLELEELKNIVFGKSKKKDLDKKTNLVTKVRKQNKKRLADSYCRKIPLPKDITSTKTFSIKKCSDCNTKLTRLKNIDRFVEDILPVIKWYKHLKKVKKEIIISGYCKSCNKRVLAKEISSNKVTLGKNIRQYISFMTVVLKLSYSQVQNVLEATMNIKVSNGEISNILKTESQSLKQAYECKKQSILSQKVVCFDETSWKIQNPDKGNYAWVMTGAKNTDAIFLLGESRGKGVIEELIKNSPKFIGVSDDYNAYKNIFKIHSLCWAHPNRKIRDLNNSSALCSTIQKHCEDVYNKFSELYYKVSKEHKEYNKSEKNEINKVTIKLLESEFNKITELHELDPLKLTKIKKRLKEQKECYFVPLKYKGVPLDNNKSERSLRHLVLKRKGCFGSKTGKGSRIMSILYSVLLSEWWKSKLTFFQSYQHNFI